jgi:hypothetical protein
MHRATPLNSSFRAYVAGGARATIPEVDDSKYMQESKGNFMSNEARSAIEAPQNYGFTSVAADATKDAQGKILQCAETFMQFMGGNRSFPTMGNMDDRRHRLWGLEKGDTAMFRQATDFLQTHFNKDGLFHTGPRDKTVRMQLIDQDSGQNQQGQQGSGAMGQLTFFDLMPDLAPTPRSLTPGTLDTSGGTTSGQTSQSGSSQLGQKSIYQKGQQSYRFVHCTKDESAAGGTNVRHYLSNNQGYYEVNEDKFVYLGALKPKGTWAKVLTTAGPCINTKGNLGPIP